jgi:hypothetical protein
MRPAKKRSRIFWGSWRLKKCGSMEVRREPDAQKK